MNNPFITPAPPEDVIPECKLSQVPSMSGATKPEITLISGQKRNWTEKASPEPECNEQVLRKTTIEHSICLRKRVKKKPLS